MICPDCGHKMRIEKTVNTTKRTYRIERCPKGGRYETESKVIRRLPVVGPAPPGRPPAPQGSPGGIGGGLSSGSGSDSPFSDVLDPESDLKIDRARARKKKPRGPVVYDKAFALFWDNVGSTRSKGSKVAAQDIWIREGRPDVVVLMSKWGEYLASCGELYPKDVSRWLGLRGWEETYGPPRGRPAAPATRVPSPYCLAHQKSPGRPARYHVDSCPRCKHFEAAGASRESEPTPLADVAGAERFRLAKERDK